MAEKERPPFGEVETLSRHEDLARLLRSEDTPSPAQALELAVKIVSIVEELHARGVVVGSLAPERFGLTRGERGGLNVRLLDPGFPRSDADVSLRALRYRPPEHLLKGTAADVRSDIYSLGIVLYELLTGRVPIDGADGLSIIVGHLSRPPLPFEESDPDGRVPERLRRVVLRALEKDPRNRLPAVGSLREELLAAKAEATPPAPVPGQDGSPGGRHALTSRDEIRRRLRTLESQPFDIPRVAMCYVSHTPMGIDDHLCRACGRRTRYLGTLTQGVFRFLATARWAQRSCADLDVTIDESDLCRRCRPDAPCARVVVGLIYRCPTCGGSFRHGGQVADTAPQGGILARDDRVDAARRRAKAELRRIYWEGNSRKRIAIPLNSLLRLSHEETTPLEKLFELLLEAGHRAGAREAATALANVYALEEQTGRIQRLEGLLGETLHPALPPPPEPPPPVLSPSAEAPPVSGAMLLILEELARTRRLVSEVSGKVEVRLDESQLCPACRPGVESPVLAVDYTCRECHGTSSCTGKAMTVILEELPAVLSLVGDLSREIGIRLDASRLCKACRPDVEDPGLDVEIAYGPAEGKHRVEGISIDDLRLMKELLANAPAHVDGRRTEWPLAHFTGRLRKLFGVERHD